MTTPDQPRTDQHGRGVRGAINDLLGREDRTDDRRDAEGRLGDERSDARADAGYDPRTDDAGYQDAGYQDPDVLPAGSGSHVDGPGDLSAPAGARQADVDPVGYGAHSDTTDADAEVHRSGVQTRTGDPDDVDGTPVPAQHQDQTRFDDPRNDNGQYADLGGPAGAHATDVDGAASPAATTTPVTPEASGPGSVAETSQGEDSDGRERLVSTERAESYSSRWDAVKGEFVDEPRKAVADADALVGELLDELQTLFTEQRRGIEHGLNTDETSTEDMRLALRRYRSFFDRLLSI